MGLGWLDAIAPAATSLYTGFQQGNLAADELQRKRAEDALRQQLLQTQIEHYAREDQKWQPTTEDEAAEYELRIHPERSIKPVGSTPQSEWAKAGFQDTPEGRDEYLRWIGQKSRAEFPERFTPHPRATDNTQLNRRNEGLGYLEQYRPGQTATPELRAQADAFHEAFRAIRQGNPRLDPGVVSYQAMESARRSQPELWRAQPAGGFEEEYLRLMREGGAGEEGAIPTAQPDAGGVEPVAPVAPVAPVTSPQEAPAPAAAPPGQKRVITQDQAEYLQAIGRWDPTLYEVR